MSKQHPKSSPKMPSFLGFIIPLDTYDSIALTLQKSTWHRDCFIHITEKEGREEEKIDTTKISHVYTNVFVLEEFEKFSKTCQALQGKEVSLCEVPLFLCCVLWLFWSQ
jgi:hypothetical protein